jgi:hypothetical protein
LGVRKRLTELGCAVSRQREHRLYKTEEKAFELVVHRIISYFGLSLRRVLESKSQS